jgi:hypothetical protein
VSGYFINPFRINLLPHSNGILSLALREYGRADAFENTYYATNVPTWVSVISNG